MQLHQIVLTLVGPIRATGDHGVDKRRLDNLKELTVLIDRLLFEVYEISLDADRQEASMKAIGIHAKEFLEDIRDV